MAMVNVRIDDPTRAQLEAVARGQGRSVSEVIREAIDGVLGRGRGSAAISDQTRIPATLTLIERRTLALQHEVLARLDPAEADYHERCRQVLEQGFAAEYENEFYAFSPELSRPETRLVVDVLEMFSVLKRSVDALNPGDLRQIGEHARHAFAFQGFDFNDTYEGRLASYARYLIDDDRWQDLAERFDSKHELGNSHMPMLATYRRMLAVFRPIWKDHLYNESRGHGDARYRLSFDELVEVYAAWPHPHA